MPVRRISRVEELLPALEAISSKKNLIPVELRDWVDVLELYVQLDTKVNITKPSVSVAESLIAGDKYNIYFSATYSGEYFRKFTKWKIKKFDQKTWEKRFAHLVEPTFEIAWYISVPDKENHMKSFANQSDVNNFKTYQLPKVIDAAKHFQSTGEWIDLHNRKCLSCGQRVSWWTYCNREPCPHCSCEVRGEVIYALKD